MPPPNFEDDALSTGADVFSNEIRGSEKQEARVGWIVVVVLVAFGLGFPWIMHVPLVIRPGVPNPIIIPFVLIALVMIARASWLTFRLKRFGDPTLILTTVPVPCGGTVEGRVNLGAEITNAPKFQVRLQCIHSYVENSGRNSHRVENILWSAENEEALLPGGIVPVSLLIPEDQPQTRGDRMGDRILWRLTVTAPFRGVPFLEKYEIPVRGETEAAAQAHRARAGTAAKPSDNDLRDANKQKRFALIFMLLFGTVVAVFGSFLMVHAVRDLRMAAASPGWPTVSGQIVGARTGPSNSLGQPEISYRYMVNDASYVGTIVQPHAFWTSRARQQLVHDFPLARDVPVHYAPDHPGDACLITGLAPRVFQSLVASTLVLSFAGLLIVSGACAPRYGIVTGNTISFPKGSLPSRLNGWLFLSVFVQAVVLWLVT